MPAAVLSTLMEKIECTSDHVQNLRFSQRRLKVTDDM